MSINATSADAAVALLDPETSRVVRRILIRLASDQEEAAASEAAQVPYWKPCPHSVLASRAAARALRECAETLPTYSAIGA